MAVGYERLTQLFESTLSADDPDGVQSFVHYEQLLESQGDVNVAAGFTMLAMALQEKPHLQRMAITAYRRVLMLIEEEMEQEQQPSVLRRKKWEKCAIFQQMGKLLIRQKQYEEAEKILVDLLGYIPGAGGAGNGSSTSDENYDPPKRLFEAGGEGFHFEYTAVEFTAQIHKLLCKLYHDLKREQECKMHYEMSINLLTDGGKKASAAVPRDVQKKIAEHNKSPLTWDSMEKVKIVAMDQSSYSWDSSAQNGTVALYLKLPDDIEKAEQVKWSCPDSECLYFRMRPMSNDKEYRLVLSPLRNAINAEDTVAKMLKKKYSFLLFMKDRSIKRWGEDLLRDAPNKHKHLLVPAPSSKPLPTLEEFDARAKSLPTPQDTYLNPLSKLPTAADVVDEKTINRPSAAKNSSASSSTSAKAPASAKKSKQADASAVGQKGAGKQQEQAGSTLNTSSSSSSAEDASLKTSREEGEKQDGSRQPPAPGAVSGSETDQSAAIDLCALTDPQAQLLPPSWAAAVTFEKASNRLFFEGIGADTELDIEISDELIRLGASGEDAEEFTFGRRKIDLGNSVAKRKKKKGTLEIAVALTSS